MALETIQDRSNRSAEAEVFYPENEADLVALLKRFNTSKTPVTIAASKTTLTGSCVPESGVVISVMQLDPLPEKKSLKSNQKLFQPAITIDALDILLGKDNKVYLPTPGYKKCSLGGNVATNASGPRTFSFGSTRDHVWFLRVVLMDGEILEINRGDIISEGEDFMVHSLGGKTYEIPYPNYLWAPIKNATGLYATKSLDLIDLFIGSEGILGVITQVGINTHKFMQSVKTEAYFFESENEALACAAAAREYGFDSKTNTGFIAIEFMDAGALQLTKNKHYENYKAALEIEYFVDDEALILFWQSLQTKYTMPEKLVGPAVAEFRYSIPLNLSNLLRKYNTVKVASDFSVPSQNFAAMWDTYKVARQKFETLSQDENITTAIWGHIGDCHVHCNFIPQSTEQQALAKALYLGLAQACVQLGGVVSAEHGVGKKKFVNGQTLLELQNPDMIPVIQKIKAALDPLFLLNVGNMVSRPSGKGRKEV